MGKVKPAGPTPPPTPSPPTSSPTPSPPTLSPPTPNLTVTNPHPVSPTPAIVPSPRPTPNTDRAQCLLAACGCSLDGESWCTESNANVGSDWCQSSPSNCATCSGVWCSGGSPPGTPPTPATPATPPTPVTPPVHDPSCPMPAGIPDSVPEKNNKDFVKCHGKLRVEGVQLVDEHGQAIQLMGMSSHGLHWFPNCYSKEAIQHLVEHWGINLFRAAMYVGEGGYSQQPDLKSTVKSIVQWCKELGIYVMIDWHVLTPGNPNAATYAGAIPFFDEMAAEYKDEKHVLFEICNEPNGVQWSEVKTYADGVISAIRAIDNNTVVIVGTPTWSQDIHEARKNPVSLPNNIMYAFHFYAGTHMQLMQRVREEAKQIPIFATEWGTSYASGDGGPFLDNAKAFLDLFNDASGQKISWAQWSFADKQEKSAALQPGACASQAWDLTSCSGTFLKAYIKMNAPTCGLTPEPEPEPEPEPTTTTAAPAGPKRKAKKGKRSK